MGQVGMTPTAENDAGVCRLNAECIAGESHDGACHFPSWHTAENDAPFISIPSGVGIAHYFVEETERRNPGCDGINLWREGRDYSYLWVEAFVDLDMWHAYLLDIRTNIGTPPGQIGETRDFLYVFHGAGDRFDVEWHNQPIDFGAATDAHWSRFEKGMAWFASSIEKSVEDADSTRVIPPGREDA